MNSKYVSGSISLVGALLIAATAYAARPSWPGPEGGSRTMPMGAGMMMGSGMMGHGPMMGMMPRSGPMQEMMEQCRQMMQSRTMGMEGRGGPQEEAPRTPDDPR